MVRFIVLGRKGYEPDPHVQWYRVEPHQYIAEEPPMEVSSTQIRNLLAVGEKADAFLDPAVAHYIEENGLYKGAK
jgi:nicotinic acid mononucleotide adenylyltransferase